jgi:hypothetical protein
MPPVLGNGQIVTGQNAQGAAQPTSAFVPFSNISDQTSSNLYGAGNPAMGSSAVGQDFVPAGKPMSVDSVSLAGGFGFGPFFGWSPTAQGSVGLAIDSQGRVGLIGTGGGSWTGGHGAGWNGGANLSTSNAGSITNLAGPFTEESVGGGDGLAAYGTGFQGEDSAKNKINGYGLTLGFGGGASYSAGRTGTVVIPLAGYGKQK